MQCTLIGLTCLWMMSTVSSARYTHTDEFFRHVDGMPEKIVVHVAGRVVGGEDATPHEFPSQVSLKYFDTNTGWVGHNCGGVILNQNWILSAAHCFTYTGNGYYEVWAGKHDLSVQEEGEQIREISITIIHPEYDTTVIGPHDLALARVNRPFVFSATVQPIDLPQPDAMPIGPAIISSWGSVSDTVTSIMPTILQRATVPILSFDECAEVLSETLFDKSNVCTGPLEGGVGTCGGDSGSGLMQRNGPNGFMLAGIVSWGWFPCGQPNSPTAYARVSHYIDWINSNTQT